VQLRNGRLKRDYQKRGRAWKRRVQYLGSWIVETRNPSLNLSGDNKSALIAPGGELKRRLKIKRWEKGKKNRRPRRH